MKTFISKGTEKGPYVRKKAAQKDWHILQVTTTGIIAVNIMKRIEKNKKAALLRVLLPSLPMPKYRIPMSTPTRRWTANRR